VLRVAIGWHFLYEGLTKIESYRDGTRPFSAEGYLTNASGPLRKWLLEDPDGVAGLEPASVARRWEDALQRLDRRYSLTEEQMTNARTKMRELELAKEEYFGNADTRKKTAEYVAALDQVAADEQSDLAYKRERAREKRRELAKTRDELTVPVDAWEKTLREHVVKQLTPEQKSRDEVTGLARTLRLPFPLSWPAERLEQINLLTMLGLTLAGGMLIIGLFSRLSALWAAGFLAALYLLNPAPPLGPVNAADPGHYLYVNKELVECFAALVLATIPTGRWLGLDALIRGLITRRLSARLFGWYDDTDTTG
jgi:uncharacterized membrane protein YphA (DoxX/SURF4 family)